MKALLLSALFATTGNTFLAVASSVAVDTPLGPVIGSDSDPRFGNGVESFLGLRFASVPQRFAKSTLHDALRVYIDATKFGPYCWQALQDDIPYYEDQEQAEDCLFLNIWRPLGTAPTSKIPVMVYIHGGGWGLQGSADPPSWGHNLARDQNVMVISINYRLGIFGFLATDEDGSNGMNAFDDQVNALRWIHRYVEYFGGDPDSVTIFGQSTGSASVCYLSVNPSARGLFHRGIMQSGECMVGDDRPDAIGLISGEEGYDITLDILDSLGSTSIEDLADRDKYPAAEIATARKMGDPILDRTVLPDFPSFLFRDPANIIPSQLLVGANTYDDPALAPPFGAEVATSLTAFELEIQSDFPNDNVDELIRTYSPDNDKYGGSLMNAYSQYQGDKKIFCNQRQFAEYVANGLKEDSVYLYQYGALTSYDPVQLRGLFNEFDNTDPNWATHGAEIAMVFGTFEETSTEWWYTSSPYVPPTDEELALHQELISRWASFAKTGSPNNENYQGWNTVSKVGPNRDGSATQMDQLYFASDYGSFMSNSATLTPVTERCSAFPNWTPFAVITESPTDFPTFSPRPPTRRLTSRPSRRPTRRPSRHPTRRPSRRPTSKPTKQPSKKPTRSPTSQSCQITAGDDPSLSCASGQFCQLPTGVCLTRSAYWSGICVPEPDICTADMKEVCGCDDATYSNECVAHSVPVNVASVGRCLTDSPTAAPVEPTPSPSHQNSLPTPSPVIDALTNSPSDKPTPNPIPTTDEPSFKPTQPPIKTSQPTIKPSPSPVTPAPSPSPVTPAPSPSPVTPAPSPSPVTPASVKTPNPTEDQRDLVRDSEMTKTASIM